MTLSSFLLVLSLFPTAKAAAGCIDKTLLDALKKDISSTTAYCDGSLDQGQYQQVAARLAKLTAQCNSAETRAIKKEIMDANMARVLESNVGACASGLGAAVSKINEVLKQEK